MFVIGPSAPASRSERRYLAAVADQPGLCIANFTISGAGGRARQIDALIIKPRGLYVVEVKGTARRGEVKTSANWPWTVGGRTESFHVRTGNPATQASLNAKVLKSVLRADFDPGFIHALVALDGDELDLETAEVIAGDAKVTLIETIEGGLDVRFRGRNAYTIERIGHLLDALDVPEAARPSTDQLIAEGFEHEQVEESGSPTGLLHRIEAAWTQRQRAAARRARELERRTQEMVEPIRKPWRDLLFPSRDLLLVPVFLPVYLLPLAATTRPNPDFIAFASHYASMTFEIGSLLWIAGYLRARLGAFITLIDLVILFSYPVVIRSYFIEGVLEDQIPAWAFNGLAGWAAALLGWALLGAWVSRVVVDRSAASLARQRAAADALVHAPAEAGTGAGAGAAPPDDQALDDAGAPSGASGATGSTEPGSGDAGPVANADPRAVARAVARRRVSPADVDS